MWRGGRARRAGNTAASIAWASQAGRSATLPRNAKLRRPPLNRYQGNPDTHPSATPGAAAVGGEARPLARDSVAETVRGEAPEILSIVIDRLTIYPDGNADPEDDVVARVADVLACVTNDNAAREGGVRSSCGIWLRGQDLNL